ncbi:MAG: hypothetical protein U5R31_08550 [Acidimicrobiia bacterium]|nr:hypothetical protein [Acidimicrobiia bacterium]
MTSCVPGNPIVALEGGHERVERIADNAPDLVDAGCSEALDEEFRNCGHERLLVAAADGENVGTSFRIAHSATPVAVPNRRCALTSFHNVWRSYAQTGS